MSPLQMDEELVKAQQSAYYAAQDEEAEARDESSKKRKSDDKVKHIDNTYAGLHLTHTT